MQVLVCIEKKLLENEGVFNDHISEKHNVFPDKTVLQIVELIHLFKLSISMISMLYPLSNLQANIRWSSCFYIGMQCKELSTGHQRYHLHGY